MSALGVLLADRYRLESRIAAGSVGEVWRAEDLVLGRPVAVKVLQEGYASHPQTLARFRAEARHAGSLAHPGVAHVYDYGETGPAGRPYLVLELVDGPSLAGVLAGGPLDPAATMGIVAQVAAGLAAAHAAGLVHRDIKPANLLMGRDGQVKITDFGIAHAAGSAPITQVGTLVGTPAYLAPERGAGEPATPASDLYSLGMVAYECLTGTLPFHGTPLEVASASRFGSLPALPADVPAPVTALVSDLTAKDPAARPGSSAEVAARAAQLRDALNGGPLAGPSGRPGTRPSAPVTSHTAVLPDPQAPATEMLDWPPAAPPARSAPGRQPGRARAGWVAGLAVVLVALAGWLLVSAVRGPASPASPAAAPPASPAVPTQGPPTVYVNAAALVGRPVGAVRQQLADRGLRTRVIRSVTGGQRPGTVVSVQPGGRVAEGSIITVAAAVAPSGHHHHQGEGHGDGKGGGHGGGG
jgi:serine/threonine-protein kinase